MSGKLEVSFNSPQCGWMSIGFDDGENEFHTTTAYTPHATALSNILKGLTSLLDSKTSRDAFIIEWSRNPEEFDLSFRRDGSSVHFELVEYPTISRSEGQGETVFTYEGDVREFCESFYATFAQLWDEKDTDEFEFNWRQPFPVREFEEFKGKMERA